MTQDERDTDDEHEEEREGDEHEDSEGTEHGGDEQESPEGTEHGGDEQESPEETEHGGDNGDEHDPEGGGIESSDDGENDIDWEKIEERPDTDAEADEPFPTPAEGEPGSVPEAVGEDAFEEMDAAGVGADEAWADVIDEDGEKLPEEATADSADDEKTPDIDDDETAPADIDEEMAPADIDDEEADPEERFDAAEIAEVSKHDYCETCEYFSEAPEIHCTHEGTEILDFTDMDSVRVANCPIVAEREGFEQGIAKGGTDIGEIQPD